MEIAIIALLVVCIALQVVSLMRKQNVTYKVDENDKVFLAVNDIKREQNELRTGVVKEISEGQVKNQNLIYEQITQLYNVLSGDNDKFKTEVIRVMNEGQTKNGELIRNNMDKLQNHLVKNLVESLEQQSKMQEVIRQSLVSIQESTEKRLSDNGIAVNKTISEGLSNIQRASDNKLSEIQKKVDERLDKNLNERLDQSFKQVGERLESLYKSLGELKSLENGVTNLNRTLSNVKSRGVYGEMALENILANILDKSQYETNVTTIPKSSERVEFAVKIPDKDNKGFIYLPIDSKFPADIYGKVLDASENADAQALKLAINELKMRIRKEAMTIRDKYVSPPNTTDFAIMFLPTEGLYSEVLRIDGLVEECQDKYKIVISGPTTLTAILNSLSVGFKYLTVNKKSEEIVKLLGNFKSQFVKFNDLISNTQKKISAAQSETEKLRERSNMIQKKLDKVEAVEYDDIIPIVEFNE